MAAHAPYIMPDGRSLGQYLAQERERELIRRRTAELRGKDLQFMQLIRQRTTAVSDLDVAELKAMENAGVRRRRRWLNDKTLRDLAGPLSAADMEAQFKPVPFGVAVPSPLAQVMTPANAALWDNFRSIDPEKEARVLQKWAAHQRESAPLRRRPMTQAALALKRWAAVTKKARAALKRACPSSVMHLELQILGFFGQAGPGDQLVLPLDNSFARILVHGLAEFYGLLSTTRSDATSDAVTVIVYRRSKPLATGQPDISLGLGALHVGPGSVGTSGPSPSPSSSRRGGTSASGSGHPRGLIAELSPARSGSSQAVGSSPAGPHVHSVGAAAQSLSPSPSPDSRQGSSSSRAMVGASPHMRQGARPVSASTSVGEGARGQTRSGSGRRTEEDPLDHEITCTDVLLAMAEVGKMGLNEEILRRYVHVHIHGTMGPDGHHLQHQHQSNTRIHAGQHCTSVTTRQQ